MYAVSYVALWLGSDIVRAVFSVVCCGVGRGCVMGIKGDVMGYGGSFRGEGWLRLV